MGILLKNPHVLANAATAFRKSVIFVAAFARTWSRIFRFLTRSYLWQRQLVSGSSVWGGWGRCTVVATSSELAIMRVGGQGAIADTIPGF